MIIIFVNMDMPDENRVVIQPLAPEWYGGKVAAVDMLRLDLIHPIISGNKWYKLQYNLQYALANGYNTILTFGGGYSNHLAATARVTKLFGIKSIGIIRGKYPELTATLTACMQDGMELIFVTQADYKRKDDKDWIDTIIPQDGKVYVIPEGGANDLGIKGAAQISKFCKSEYSYIAMSVGTGSTFAGIRNELHPNQKMLGFVPMKYPYTQTNHYPPNTFAEERLASEILDNDLKFIENTTFFYRWHFGGFGKWNTALLDFMNEFYSINAIPTDVVYTGKMMYGIRQLIDEGYIHSYDRVLCIHTGGLQGNASVKNELIF